MKTLTANTTRELAGRHKSLFTGGLVALVLLTSSMTRASENTSALHLPEDAVYYNPLKHGRQDGHDWNNGSGLDNKGLEIAAKEIRSSEMSHQQRALNHQWLNNNYPDEHRFGTRILSKLFKMGFRTYWDGVRNKHYKNNNVVPDSSGNGRVSEDMDYKIRLSDDKVKLSVKYEF